MPEVQSPAMGKFGEYPYPEIGPKEAAHIARIIKENIGDTIEQSEREKLAELLDHQGADSGAFRQKLTALNRYGLLKGRGTLHTTELADRLVEGDETVYYDMLDQVHLLKEAYDWSDGREIPFGHSRGYSRKNDPSTWRDFVRARIGIDEEFPSKLKTHYEEFLELLPEEPRDDAEQNYLDKEREFKYYIDKLENENTRQPAIQALKSKISSKRIPDKDPLIKIIEILEEERFPHYQEDFFRILHLLCRNNDLDRFGEDQRDQVIDFLYEKLDQYTQEGTIEDREGSIGQILDTLEVIFPADLVDQLWTLLTERLQKASERENDNLRRFAVRDLAARLMTGRDDVVTEFYETKQQEAEDELWDMMATTPDSDLQDDCEYILGRMDVL